MLTNELSHTRTVVWEL